MDGAVNKWQRGDVSKSEGTSFANQEIKIKQISR